MTMSENDSQDFRAHLERIDQSVQRIELALTGDERLGHTGLVSGVRRNSERISKLEAERNWVLGAAAAISTVVGLVAATLGQFFRG
jgi:hypothetical protein